MLDLDKAENEERSLSISESSSPIHKNEFGTSTSVLHVVHLITGLHSVLIPAQGLCSRYAFAPNST